VNSSKKRVSLPESLLQWMAGRGWPLAWQVKEELEKTSACVLTGGEVMLAGTVRGRRQYHNRCGMLHTD